MRNIFHCRRGSVAFATVIALVPLIGFVALGAEAGSWYVTKQHAQTAADAAAYSGGLQRACELSGLSTTNCDATTPATRGKQIAAQNGFCNTGDTSYAGSRCVTSLPSGTSQAVIVAPLTTWNGNSGNFVQATVRQQQPGYMANLLGLSTLTIAATAVASVSSLAQPPCVLALNNPINFQGSPTITSTNCGVASDSSAADAIGFKGNNGLHISAPSYTVGGCSQTSSSGHECDTVQTYQAKIPDPLSNLNLALSLLTTSDFSGPCTNPDSKGKPQPALKAYSATTSLTTGPCYNTVSPPNGSTLDGTYYFNGTVDIGSVSGTAALVLFGSSAKISKITGSPTIQLTGQTNPQGPSALSSVLGLMKNLVIYDPEVVTASNKSVDISGNSNIVFNGTVYMPNANVTYGGNSSFATPGCFQVIAYGVTFSGNTKVDNSGCASGTPKPQVTNVRLVTQ